MSVTTLQLLNDLQGVWGTLQVELLGSEDKPIADVYPFLSVSDLKRLIWIQQNGDPRWAPERVFLGIRNADGRYRPLEFHWMESLATLPDPLAAGARQPAPQLIDTTGNRIPISPVMVGGMLLEDALGPEIHATGVLPRITAIPLAELQISDADADTLTPQLFGGFYQLYFPWLTAPAQIIDASVRTPAIMEAYASVVPYMEDRAGRISVVQTALSKGVTGPTVSMNSVVRMRWTLPTPSVKPTSLELAFYSMQASESLPFLRYFPAAKKGAPILKLGVRPDGTPIITDEKTFTKYLNQPAPTTKSAVIMARVPLVSANTETGSAFTIYMFEDGTSDITLEVPQRGMKYVTAVAAEAERMLPRTIASLGFPAGTQPILRDLHATYSWTHPNPSRSQPISAARMQQRVLSLTPFLEMSRGGDEFPFIWRAVSNYDSEVAQFAFITSMILSSTDEEGEVLQSQYQTKLMAQFGITLAEAESLMEKWYERNGKAVAPAAGAGSFAVPKHNTGARISISGSHPTYHIEVQGIDSYMELQRIMSVVGVLLGAAPADLVLRPPVPVVNEQVSRVEIAEARQEEAAEAAGPPADEETDFDMMDLMSSLGFGGGGGENLGSIPEEEVAEIPPSLAPPAPPDVDKAMEETEQECGGVRWTPGEPPLKLPKSYYVSRLQSADKELFGYTHNNKGRAAGYSKSCQHSEGRQPDIMSLAEYARVKRCYEGKVRFVNLPPQKPEDMDIPWFTNIKKYNASEAVAYATVDEKTGLPIWIVYGYQNKTRTTEYTYLMCARYWCVRDNLPLLLEEFASIQGRGFTKPPNTCPFCGGAAIEDELSPRSGESVIVRKLSSDGTVHAFIGEMGTVAHPSGFTLPCCNKIPGLLRRFMEQKLLGTLTYGAQPQSVIEKNLIAEANEAIADRNSVKAPASVKVPYDSGITDYSKILSRMRAQYVIGRDKQLTAGSIGLLPATLDALFGQDGPDSIARHGIRSTFKDNTAVFVRIGVDTYLPKPGLNFFAGLAPLLGATSSMNMRQRILRRPLVRAFESANYGTLVHEFAARSTRTDAEIEPSLQQFATENGYVLGLARPHVIRLYKAWIAFVDYINDDLTPKRSRHFEHLLAAPGIITPLGLLLVVMEQDGDKTEIKCPAFGIPTASIYKDVPIAFMMHNRRADTWEPIVLYNNTEQAVIWLNERTPALESLPQTMKAAIYRWLGQWRSSSVGCGRPAPPPHVWTPERDMGDLPRLGALISSYKTQLTALVRDRSNRLAGVIISNFFVPCLDDGTLAEGIPRIYETAMIPPLSANDYIRFYTNLRIAALMPVKLLTRDEQIVGFQVAAGTMIPVAAEPVTDAVQSLPLQQVDEFVWERDAHVLRAPDSPISASAVVMESTASVEEQLAEAYQHLRLSFSHWLQRDASAIPFKKNLGGMLVSLLPLYEKRKRMDIYLEPIVRQWIAPEKSSKRAPLSLLRTDCLTLNATECATKGACRWSSGEGRCLIHAPYQWGGDPVRIMVARLSDELLRYADARAEIMNEAVPIIRTPRGVARVGNAVYTAVQPRETADSMLKRLGFTGQIAMSFPEEMLRFEGAEEEEPLLQPLPDVWSAMGLSIPMPDPHTPDIKRIAFAAALGISLDKLETHLTTWRKQRDLTQSQTQTSAFTWSIQDFYILASLLTTNIVFVRSTAMETLLLDRWIAPASSVPPAPQPRFMILWGPLELLVTKGRQFRFTEQELPPDMRRLLEGTAPMDEAAARGYTNVMKTGAPQ